MTKGLRVLAATLLRGQGMPVCPLLAGEREPVAAVVIWQQSGMIKPASPRNRVAPERRVTKASLW